MLPLAIFNSLCDFSMLNETVYKRFEKTTKNHKNLPFVHITAETANVFGIESEEISYGQMLNAVNEWKLKFEKAGYSYGDRIGLLLQNRPVFLEIWLALNCIGLSVVPINPDLRISELEYIIEHSEMKLIISTESRILELEKAISNQKLDVDVISSNCEIPDIQIKDNSNIAPNQSTECALLYTSGTTGKPKGCILSNEYFLNCGDWYSNMDGLISLSYARERMITPLPLFHMNAMAVSVTAMITVAGCLVLLDRFHPSTWWKSVRESEATCIHYLGIMPSILMNNPIKTTDKDHSVRFGFGAGIDQKLHNSFEERFGFPLIEGWAMTETGSGGTISAHKEPRKIGLSCFGKPENDVEIKIIDEYGNDVGPNLPGELLVRRHGKNKKYGFFTGYLKNDLATKEVWKNGWFNTGDIVKKDETGSLYFIDRKKNIIRRSGENIAAVEVESILNRHPNVKICAAVAVPDKLREEEVGVFIILNESEHNRSTANKIVKWALVQMAYYKVPGYISFTNELPLTGTQKVRRGDLKNLVKNTLRNDGFYDMRNLKRRQV